MDRRPLVPRQPLPLLPQKRPRSPDPAALPPKKPRRDRDPARDHHRLEREQQRLEFREKYCRAFPAWTFYLDGDTIDSPQQLDSFRSRIQQLGAVSPQSSSPSPSLIHPLENRSLLLARYHPPHLQRSQPSRFNRPIREGKCPQAENIIKVQKPRQESFAVSRDAK